MPRIQPPTDARLGTTRLLLELAEDIGDSTGALRSAIILQLALSYRLLLNELNNKDEGYSSPLQINAQKWHQLQPEQLCWPRLATLEQMGWLAQMLGAEGKLLDAEQAEEWPPLELCRAWYRELLQLRDELRAEHAEY